MSPITQVYWFLSIAGSSQDLGFFQVSAMDAEKDKGGIQDSRLGKGSEDVADGSARG